MKLLFRIIVGIIFTSHIYGQNNAGKISGKVVGTDGSALIGANVLVEGMGIGATVDENGSYTILNVPVGDHNVQFMFIGFKTLYSDNVLVSNGLTTTVNATLEETVLEGDVVRVVAAKPLVKRDAMNTKRTVSEEVIEALAVQQIMLITLTAF